MNIHDFTRVGDYLWEVPAGYQEGMQVPARLYATERMLEDALNDRSVTQLVNTASLPGVVRYTLAMPDIHQGYGFPIGGVAATALPDGMISPGGVGYDINCGVRLLSSRIEAAEIRPWLKELATVIYDNCPSGVGRGGSRLGKLRPKTLKKLLRRGSQWALEAGYALPADLAHTEENGQLADADPAAVSQRALERGATQVGTLGAGNHFIEIDIVDQVFDSEAAQAMGLAEGLVAAQIHCGSRGLGHQVATDYVREFQRAAKKYNLNWPDRELVSAPLSAPEGQRYLGAMSAAANYAFVNRQVLAHFLRASFEQVLAGQVNDWELRLVYDVAHNIAKIETHQVEGRSVKLCVHRKGATRAFGPGAPGVPADYQAIGQPVLVPGSMGTSSYVLVGAAEAMSQSFGSACHGAGRMMSRSKAKKTVRGDKLRADLEKQGIVIRAGSLRGLAEEAPIAYKDVDDVVQVVHKAGIARKVARLRPLLVVKG